MEAVVHIGMPKTGSTTIQEFLRLNAQALERQGFLYRRYRPREVLQGEYLTLAWHALGRQFDDPLRRKRFHTETPAQMAADVAAFEKWFTAQTARTTAKVWLVSSEMLTAAIRNNRAGIEAVHHWFSTHFSRVTYVLYLRRQDLWLASSYSQQLRNGMTLTFDQYMRRARGRDYHRLASVWTAVAGGDALKLRLLEPGALVGGDLIDDFCDAAGIDPTGLARPATLNESFSRPAAAVVRRMNLITAKFLPRHSTASRAIRKLGRTVAQTLLRGEKFAPTPRQRNRVLARVAESNDALRREYFPERATLFEPPAPKT